MTNSIVDKIMKPKSIAVIGASSKVGTVGYETLKQILAYKYSGKVYPVNPKGGEIQGLRAYTKVTEIEDSIDLAVIVVPAKFVPQTIDECNEKNIKGICIISAGFKEACEEGAQLEKELMDKARKYGMRVVGPNCLGVLNTNKDVSMDATFGPTLPIRGTAALTSQSGALGCGIINMLPDLNLGLSQFVSVGNQPDINAEDMLEYWEKDDDVSQMLLYMESIVNPQNFRKLATRITKKKPIIALKSGRSKAGASAASSHTGSLAGADKAASALLKQSGVIRELDLESVFISAKAFSKSNLPKGKRVAILTNAGGPGIMATDALEDYGLEMAKLKEETKDYMKTFLPSAASVKNPVDIIASASIEQYKMSLEALYRDENVDMILAIYLLMLGAEDIDMAKAMMEVKAKYPDKPIVGVFVTKSDFKQKLAELKDEVTMPFYMYVEHGAHALKRLYEQSVWENKEIGTMPNYQVNRDKVVSIIKNSISEGRDQLTTLESIDVLEAYGIRACRYKLAKNITQAIEAANEIGYPVVMKMTSKTTSHKTDVGGVIVNIQNSDDLRKEFNALMDRLEQKGLLDGLEGVIIQEMVKGNREMVCGIATDPQYGPMLMFGLGGVFIEVMEDVTFRLSPITNIDAREMIKEIKSYPLLMGARGTKVARIEQIEETLLRLSQLVSDFDFIDELDINPLLISEKTGEGVAVDGRIKVRLNEALEKLNNYTNKVGCSL